MVSATSAIALVVFLPRPALKVFRDQICPPEYLTIPRYTEFDTSDLESSLAPLSTMCKDRHGVLKFNAEKSH